VCTFVVHVLCNQNFVHHLTILSGLQGNKCATQQIFGNLCNLFHTLCYCHTTLFFAFYLSLPPASCMYLSLNNRELATKFIFDLPVSFLGFGHSMAGNAFLHRHLELFK